jgi:hypothetical protein
MFVRSAKHPFKHTAMCQRQSFGQALTNRLVKIDMRNLIRQFQLS